jgi:hypothetical protein
MGPGEISAVSGQRIQEIKHPPQVGLGVDVHTNPRDEGSNTADRTDWVPPILASIASLVEANVGNITYQVLIDSGAHISSHQSVDGTSPPVGQGNRNEVNVVIGTVDQHGNQNGRGDVGFQNISRFSEGNIGECPPTPTESKGPVYPETKVEGEMPRAVKDAVMREGRDPKITDPDVVSGKCPQTGKDPPLVGKQPIQEIHGPPTQSSDWSKVHKMKRVILEIKGPPKMNLVLDRPQWKLRKAVKRSKRNKA